MNKDGLISDYKKKLADNLFNEQAAHNNKLLPQSLIKEKISLEIDAGIDALYDLFVRGFNHLYQYYIEKKARHETAEISFLEIKNVLSNEDTVSEDYLKKISQPTMQDAANAFNLISAIINEGQFEKARQTLYFLIAILPDCPPLLSSLGFVEYSLGNLEPAIRAYSTAFITKPDDPIPLVYAAYCLKENKQSEEALEYLNHAIEVCELQGTEMDGWKTTASELKGTLLDKAA